MRDCRWHSGRSPALRACYAKYSMPRTRNSMRRAEPTAECMPWSYDSDAPACVWKPHSLCPPSAQWYMTASPVPVDSLTLLTERACAIRAQHHRDVPILRENSCRSARLRLCARPWPLRNTPGRLRRRRRRAVASTTRQTRRIWSQAPRHNIDLALPWRAWEPLEHDEQLPCTSAHTRLQSRRDLSKKYLATFGRFHGHMADFLGRYDTLRPSRRRLSRYRRVSWTEHLRGPSQPPPAVIKRVRARTTTQITSIWRQDDLQHVAAERAGARTSAPDAQLLASQGAPSELASGAPGSKMRATSATERPLVPASACRVPGTPFSAHDDAAAVK
ncbi:hypothetical protein VTO73DRAFT_13079 [Trametes versicolor]